MSAISVEEYNTLVAKIQDLQDQIAQRNSAYKKQEKLNSILKDAVYNLCSVILGKDDREMVLGSDYHWSKVDTLELVHKAQDSFERYCAERTRLLKLFYDEVESRRIEIDDLKDQILFMKQNGNSLEGFVESSVKEQKDKNIEKLPSETKENVKNGEVELITETETDFEKEEDAFGALFNSVEKDIEKHAKPMKVSVNKSESKKKIDEMAKKKAKAKAHVVDLSAVMSGMNNDMFAVLLAIGEKGLSRYTLIESEIINNSNKYGIDLASKVRVAADALASKQVLSKESISTATANIRIFQLTDMGQRIYNEKFHKSPIASEADMIIGLHDNLTHGYLIEETKEVLIDSGKFKTVKSDNRKKPYDTGNGTSFIPDIIAVSNAGKLSFVEVERGTHTLEDFCVKCSKIAKISDEINIVCSNLSIIEKQIIPKLNEWIKRQNDFAKENHGKSFLKKLKHIRATTVKMLIKEDPTSDEAWRFEYDKAKRKIIKRDA